ncbi:uncharacterized protein BN767_01031 [Acidiphilium sp. CAG:727]|nr:uncharacterized protein BN767_01031 [Acidiphilium sp. CAG:727]
MKNAKRSVIITAILAIIMCASLAAGATFALFTSSSSVNIAVTSGNVEVTASVVDIQKSYVDENGETVNGRLFSGDATFDEGAHTVTLSNVLPKDTVKFKVKVVNGSNVAIKYRMVMSLVEDNGLFSSLDITLDGKKFYGYTSGTKYALLEAEQQIADIPVVISLPEGATCNNTACKLTYKVEAVQGNASVEDFPEVPENTLAVNTTEDVRVLEKAISGENAVLDKDVVITKAPDTVASRLSIKEPTTLNLNAMIKTPDHMGNNSNNFCALIVDADTTVNANANGGIDTGKNGGYGINVRKGAKLTINGGNYYGGGTAVQVQEGELTINGGIFAVEAFGEPYGYNFLLNCVDAAYKNGTAKIIVKGGIFKNFNPADNTAEGKHTNFVADGYTVVSMKDEDSEDTLYVVLPVSDVLNFISQGEDVVLTGDLTISADLEPSKEIKVNGSKATINANGKTVANTVDIWNEGTGAWSLVSAQGGAALTVKGNGTFKAKENDCFAVDVQDGSELVIEDGTFIGNVHAVYVYEGTAYIKGGFYSVQQKYSDASKADEFVLNCYDDNRKNGTAKIIVTGGTFVNFNPANCQAEGANTNFVADGYTVVSTRQTNGDVWYTVVAKDAQGKTFSDGKDHVLNESIAVGAADGIAVKATSGTVTIEGGTYNGGEGGNNVCVAAVGGTVVIKDGTFTVGGDANSYGNSVIYSIGGDVVIEGGFFYTDYKYNGKYYVLNKNNSTNGTITVKGGTFVNYDPSKGDDNLGGNFVAEGYKVVSETKTNGDVWYTVVKA